MPTSYCILGNEDPENSSWGWEVLLPAMGKQDTTLSYHCSLNWVTKSIYNTLHTHTKPSSSQTTQSTDQPYDLAILGFDLSIYKIKKN